MADISTELARILSAIYGEDVRGSIHDAIEKINDVSEVVLTTGTAVTSPSSSSTGFYDDSLYLNTDTFELWKCTGVNTWASQGILKGDPGADGADGKGITSIAKTATSGLVDTYTITYTDGTTSTFTVTNGEDGANGNKWYRGTGIAGKSATPTVYPYSGVTDANVGDMFLNPTEGAIYACTVAGAAATAMWVYEMTLSGGSGGTSDYPDLTNKPSINGYTLLGNKTGADLGLANSSDIPTVDQTYDATSSNAQSGKAVAEAISSIHGGGMLPYLYIDSEAGATVTVAQPDGTTITPTAAGSGHWECELTGGYGTYVIHSVLSGQGDATLSLAVDTVKEYHVTDTHYDYTINVTAPSGSTVRIVGGGEIYTGTGTGTSQAFAVHTPSTEYTVTATQIMDGNTKTDEVTVTSAATSGGSTNVTLSIEFGTINVSVAADFVTAGSTITCAKTGINTISKTAASTLTFRVPETGEYTISGTVSGTPYSTTATVTSLSTPENVDLQTTINVNVTLHGAVGAVITYTDANGSQTQTLDSMGEKTNVSISILPSNPTIVFTDTTVAKDPDDLSNNYTKSVTITDGMTDIYVMPDNALYWYGWKSDNCEDATSANGWSVSAYVLSAPTYNTNSLSCLTSGNNQLRGIGSSNKASVRTGIHAIYNGISQDSGNRGYFRIQALSNKAWDSSSAIYGEFYTSSGLNKVDLVDNSITTDDCYFLAESQDGMNSDIYALWYD